MSDSTATELFEPAEYLDQHGPGYFTVCAKPAGSFRQNSYELELLPKVVKAVDPSCDSWITQAVFSAPNRRAVNVRSVGLLFADLDTYHCDGLKGKTPEDQANLLAVFCRTEGIAVPSIVLFSGRGLQAKWLLSEAIGAAELPDWNRTQLALVNLLEPFAADTNAKDISRVLRIDHTVNTKSGEICRVVYTSSGIENCLARYDFTELSENLTARFPETAPTRNNNRAGSLLILPAEMSLKRLNWYRLYDLRDLWKLRGGVSEGFRETTLFWELNFLLRADPGKAADIWKEAETLAAEIDHNHGWYKNADLSTVYRKAKESLSGAMVTYRGRQYPPLYTPKNQTLMSLFSITPDEEQHLRTIISYQEKQRRRTAKRRAEGIVPRSQYEEDSIEKIQPWIAEGISRAWWYEKRRRGKL